MATNRYSEQDLKEAGAAMKLASIDYDDNIGSSEKHVFWQHFTEKRAEYIAIKKELNNDSTYAT